MKPKERIQAILNREPVDRAGIDLWYTPEVGEMLFRHFGVDNDFDLWRKMGLDKIAWVFMDYKTEEGGSAGSQVGAEASGERTMWGVPLREVQAGAARYQEFVEPPMAAYSVPASVENYPFWPDPDRFDYGDAERRAREASREFAVVGPWVSCYEVYCQLRGIEQALLDLAMNPDLVDAILDRVEEIQTEMMRRFFDRAADCIDLVFISDDLGGQNGPLMSPHSWERHLKPRLERWCELIHGYGIKTFYHTDGAARPFVGPLIDAGVDVLNPVQHACPGMDMRELKDEFGDRVIFHGGVDNQTVLPRGSAADVEREVRECLAALGRDGTGYICCSCHNVQAGTPLENILAMVRTVRESG